MANVINSLNFDNKQYIFTLPYGECSTAAATAAKVVNNVDNFCLETGARIAVKFTVANSATNVTLNVNSTGAKSVLWHGAGAVALRKDEIYELVYTGSSWEVIGQADTNTTYSAATTASAGLMSAADKVKLNGIATGANAYTHPSYTARTGVPTANATLTHGGTFAVTQPVSDASGHITAMNTRVYTLPADNNTKNTAGATTSSSKLYLIGAASTGANPQTYAHTSVHMTNGTLNASTFAGYLNGTAAKATTCTNAGTATYATSAGTASKATTATNAGTATYASSAGKATTCTNAGTANYAKAVASHDHSYLPLAGGTMTGNVVFNNGSSAQSGEPNLTWKKVGESTPYIGFAQDQSDGTFILSSLKGTAYATGLAIGGGSGNLLWKGIKVATVNDTVANATNASTSAYATKAGTATYATSAGKATTCTNAGTATYATSAGTASKATTCTNAGTATYATNAGTANYAKAVAAHSHNDYMTQSNPTGSGSVSIGRKSGTTIGDTSIAIGTTPTASGDYSIALGCLNEATGKRSAVVGGYQSDATGEDSFVGGGYLCKASGEKSAAFGMGSLASGAKQFVHGMYNVEDTASTYAHIVGNGQSSSTRSNAYTLDWSGNAWFAGSVTAPGGFIGTASSATNSGTATYAKSAATATRLKTARTVRTNLGSTATASFNGTANITPGVTGTLPIGNGGTGGADADTALTNLGATYTINSIADLTAAFNAMPLSSTRNVWILGTVFKTLTNSLDAGNQAHGYMTKLTDSILELRVGGGGYHWTIRFDGSAATSQYRATDNISYQTTDLTAGSSSLSTGHMMLVYS